MLASMNGTFVHKKACMVCAKEASASSHHYYAQGIKGPKDLNLNTKSFTLLILISPTHKAGCIMKHRPLIKYFRSFRLVHDRHIYQWQYTR